MEYAAAIRQEKSKSWEQYCNATSSANPWNAVYKMAAGKKKRPVHVTTLRQPDGSLTTDIPSTVLLMIQKFTPEDNQGDNSETHRRTRIRTSMPMTTEDNEQFTVQEVANVIQGLSNRKASGEDGTPNEVWKGLVEILPKYLTAIYNKCLKEGVFPVRWKKAKIVPIVNPGKEGSNEVDKFRPISLLNTRGKVLEKLLINRINHHVYSIGYMNEIQYGFRPQKGMIMQH